MKIGSTVGILQILDPIPRGVFVGDMRLKLLYSLKATRVTSINHPLIGGACVSAFRRAMTKVNSLSHPPLGGRWDRLSMVLIPWAGAKKKVPPICVLGVERFFFKQI
jgi:hypothetical protein